MPLLHTSIFIKVSIYHLSLRFIESPVSFTLQPFNLPCGKSSGMINLWSSPSDLKQGERCTLQTLNKMTGQVQLQPVAARYLCRMCQICVRKKRHKSLKNLTLSICSYIILNHPFSSSYVVCGAPFNKLCGDVSVVISILCKSHFTSSILLPVRGVEVFQLLDSIKGINLNDVFS